jgi:putative tricarboxylic transport membrane protein
MTKEKTGALIILAFSITYGAMALNLPNAPGLEMPGATPASLPLALSATAILAAASILILPARRDDEDDSVKTAFSGLDWRRVSAFFLLMVGYGLALKPLGFLISTALFLGVGFRIMGERRLTRILPVSIGVSVVFWFLLTRILSIYLEPGILRFLESN